VHLIARSPPFFVELTLHSSLTSVSRQHRLRGGQGVDNELCASRRVARGGRKGIHSEKLEQFHLAAPCECRMGVCVSGQVERQRDVGSRKRDCKEGLVAVEDGGAVNDYVGLRKGFFPDPENLYPTCTKHVILARQVLARSCRVPDLRHCKPQCWPTQWILGRIPDPCAIKLLKMPPKILPYLAYLASFATLFLHVCLRV